MKRNNFKILILFLILCIQHNSRAQNNSPLFFSAEYPKSRNADSIKLKVHNKSNAKTFYYSIALQGFKDTSWIPLISDINSLGKNEFLALKPLRPQEKITKFISRKKIFEAYKHKKFKEFRLGVMYYDQPSLKSKGNIIYLQPFPSL